MFSCIWCFYWCMWEQHVFKLSLLGLYKWPHTFVPQQIMLFAILIICPQKSLKYISSNPLQSWQVTYLRALWRRLVVVDCHVLECVTFCTKAEIVMKVLCCWFHTDYIWLLTLSAKPAIIVFCTVPVEGWKPLSLCRAVQPGQTDMLSRFSHFFLFLTWWLCRRSCLSWLCLCLCVWMMYELLLSMIRLDPPLQWLTPVQAQSSPWCLWIHVVYLCLCLCFLYLCFS